MIDLFADTMANLPVPSDIELAAADRRIRVEALPADNLVVAVQIHQARLMSCNEFVLEVGLTYQCMPFHAYIKAAGLAGTRQTEAKWWTWFGRMLKDEDAKDQADTLADSLT